jgi:hypothetical protein
MTIRIETEYTDLHPAYMEMLTEIAPEVLTLFASKAYDYGDTFLALGVKGQFSDINRKFLKLKQAVWEDRELMGEQPEEIVMDMIGHCLLMLWGLRHPGEVGG